MYAKIKIPEGYEPVTIDREGFVNIQAVSVGESYLNFLGNVRQHSSLNLAVTAIVVRRKLQPMKGKLYQFSVFRNPCEVFYGIFHSKSNLKFVDTDGCEWDTFDLVDPELLARSEG